MSTPLSSPSAGPTRHGRPRLTRWIRRHRRPVAATLAGLSVLLLAAALRPSPAPTVDVVLAAGDLDAGRVLATTDVTIATVPTAHAAPGSYSDPAALIGHVLVGPMQAGEQVTASRLLGERPQAGRGRVAAPVRLADPGLAALLRPGDLIDLLAASENGIETVAHGARVITRPEESVTGPRSGALLIVAMTPGEATALAGVRGRDLTAVLVAGR